MNSSLDHTQIPQLPISSTFPQLLKHWVSGSQRLILG
jgi:hypothetical protein